MFKKWRWNCYGTAAVVFSAIQCKKQDGVGESWIAETDATGMKAKNEEKLKHCCQVKPTD